jgi:hypothetical protein
VLSSTAGALRRVNVQQGGIAALPAGRRLQECA